MKSFGSRMFPKSERASRPMIEDGDEMVTTPASAGRGQLARVVAPGCLVLGELVRQDDDPALRARRRVEVAPDRDPVLRLEGDGLVRGLAAAGRRRGRRRRGGLRLSTEEHNSELQ